MNIAYKKEICNAIKVIVCDINGRIPGYVNIENYDLLSLLNNHESDLLIENDGNVMLIAKDDIMYIELENKKKFTNSQYKVSREITITFPKNDFIQGFIEKLEMERFSDYVKEEKKPFVLLRKEEEDETHYLVNLSSKGPRVRIMAKKLPLQ